MLPCPPLLRCLCAAAMLIVLSNRASSQEQNFADRLFPPELVMQHRSDLQLSGEQVQKITQIIGQFSQKATNAQDRAEQHSQELARLLDAKSTSEAETLQQLKSYLSAEQERQQAHYSALLRIRGLLTAEQRSLLSTIRKTRPPQRSAQQAIPPAAGPTEQRLRARRDQIQRIVQSRATRGIPSDSVGRLMQQFSEHIQQGRVREAEATLDRALQSLRQQDGQTPPKRNDPQGFVEIHQGQATALEMLATGHEQLQWGAGDVTLQTEPDARHLMAGHPIDLDSRVIYGLTARRR